MRSSNRARPAEEPALVTSALALARDLLEPVDQRWPHVYTAARTAADELALAVPAHERNLLVAAAALHDIGYAPQIVDTGFHPLDGARYLERHGWPNRLAALVAHHSDARTLAEARGLSDQLAGFIRETGAVADALLYADMTSGIDGQRLTLSERLADIYLRHAAEDPSMLAARRRREPQIRAAVRRVEQRLSRRRGSVAPPGPVDRASRPRPSQ
jgi:hypothetical protein